MRATMKDTIKAIASNLPETLKVFASKWWVTPAVIILIITALLFSIFYTQKEELGKIAVQKMGREHFIARFDETKFNVEISALVKNSKAASASVWMIDVGSNKKRMIYRYIAETGQEESQHYNEDYPLFYFDENILGFGKLNTKAVSCLNLVPETNYGEQLAKEGVSYICFVKVPPESGQFIGIIQLEFYSKPPELILSEQQNNPAKRMTFNNRLTNASKRIIK